MSDTLKPARVGVIGCGNISDTYFKNLPTFSDLVVTACADLDPARAKAKAAHYGLRALTPEALLADPDVDAVVNLTIPAAHAEVNRAALAAGKHVYTEKPLGVTREDGRQALDLARAHGLRLGAAPDTFLGGGLQTARQLIDEGVIGELVGFTCNMFSPGHESWHPDPAFYYQPGGGPLFDMGPYYLTALIHLFGPVRRVTGSARVTLPERTITSKALYGQKIKVNTPTHIIAALEFASGPIGTLVTTFDVGLHHTPRFEVYGTDGSLTIHDPNTFGGPITMRCRWDKDWHETPLTHGYNTNMRGLGVADMLAAEREGRPHRASGELGYHVLDLMHGVLASARDGRHYTPESTCARPAAMPTNEAFSRPAPAAD
ncbi:MAG: Gfo/Idh/MocA family oxidoreductase [Anaerolineales bacterium]|nr:Gfo/Idh/MocA family oxidoreductase [Anaerolineales bacterium]